MTPFAQYLKSEKTIIAMIHVPALPGTPFNNLTPKEIINLCLKEARIYKDAGIDTVAIENMHDVPYLNRKVGTEITSLMSIIGYEIKKTLNMNCGIQILAGANKDAIAAAYSAGLDFIRAEGFVFAHVADEGLMNSDAGELLRYRKQIGAENIAVLTDIKKKHSSHAVTSDITISETVRAADFFKSDGIIITGESTGKEALTSDLEEVVKVTGLPILIGSGVTSDNISKYYKLADGFIIGSHFKTSGNWQNGVSKSRVKNFVKAFEKLGG